MKPEDLPLSTRLAIIGVLPIILPFWLLAMIGWAAHAIGMVILISVLGRDVVQKMADDRLNQVDRSNDDQ
ncbi:MAG: hypothetical protein CMF70_06905 [Magnetovibrio sp.]|nr:hypothetical protein [Magnetovibrio sp.]|tara:strand:- start:1128 stop:1337 length:210 start_codon:yes stop_codon:yes gene_type:complete